MKTRSAAATILAAKPAVEPIHFAVIEFTAPAALTLRVSDRYLPKSGGFEECLPLVQAWGTIDEPLQAADAGGSPATFDGLALFNDVPVAGRDRLSDLMYSPDNPTGYEFAFAKISVYRMDADLGAGTEELLGVFYLEDPTEIGEHLLRLRASDITQVIENQLGLVTITRALFPFAHPDAIDRTIPIAIGRLDRVPSHLIETGGTTTLAAAVAIGATVLPVTSTAVGFPSTAPFFILIDGEPRSVSAMTPASLTVDPLTAEHALGAAVRELRFDGGSTASTTIVNNPVPPAAFLTVVSTADFPQVGTFLIFLDLELLVGFVTTATRIDLVSPITQSHFVGDVVRIPSQIYRYGVCENRNGHMTRAVPTVYNRGVRLTSGFTINLDDRDLIPGRSFVTITLDALPATAVPSATIEVVQLTPSTVIRHGTNTPTISRVGVGSVNGTVTVPAAPVGTIVAVQRTISIQQLSWGSGGAWVIERQGGADIWTGSGSETPISGTFTYATGATYDNEVITLTIGAGGSGTYTIRIDALTVEVEVTGSIKTGAVSPIGSADEEPAITASIEGMQDDDLGSITGTPRALLERPADIAALLLVDYPSTSLADRGSHWDLTRTRQAGLSLAFLLGADGPERFSDLRRLIGMQGRCRLFTEAGKIDLRYIEDAPAIDLTLDYQRDVWEQQPAVAAKTSRTQVFNRVVVSAQRDYAGGAGFRYSQTFEDLTQPGLRDPIETTLELPWVQDAGVADRLGAFWLARWKRPRFQVNAVGWQNLLALEKGDHLAVTNHPVLAAHGGATRPCAIYRKSYRLGDENPARIQVTAIEASA